jgi:dTDP-4-amino-4,6-dideoxygalactose transaminase
MIRFLDLPAEYHGLKTEIDRAVGRVLESGQFVGGTENAALEEEFANYCGARHGVAVNSGTSALHLALLGAGVQPGDEVITVPFTFYATVAAIGYVGATPVYVDIDPATFNIDSARIEAAITCKTRAILLVHLSGQCADTDPILEIARRHSLIVIEDAAQAHGAEYRDRARPAKAVCSPTTIPNTRERRRCCAVGGEEQRYRPRLKGFNYRLPSIQAAILRVKLRRLEAWIEARRARAAEYDGWLEAPGLSNRRPCRMRARVLPLHHSRGGSRRIAKRPGGGGHPDRGSLSAPDSPNAGLRRSALSGG